MKHLNISEFCKIIALLIIVLAASIATFSQQPTATPDLELDQAKRKKEIAELNSAAAEAQAKMYKSMLGALDTSGLPKGEVSAKTTDIESSLLAYRAVDNIADRLASILSGLSPRPTRIVIYSAKEVNNLAAYKAFIPQVTELLKELVELRKVAPLKKCSPSTSDKSFPPFLGVETALQVISLFKTDTSYEGKTITADEFAIATIVMAKLRAKGIESVYPPAYFPGILTTDSADQYLIYKTYRKLSDENLLLDNTLSELKANQSELDALIKSTSPGECRTYYQSQLFRHKTHEERAAAAKSVLTQLLAALMKPDESTGMTLLYRYAVAERMASQFDSGYLLKIAPIAAGGTARTKTNIFGSSLSFGGGALISFMLTSPEGDYVTSGTIPAYGGFVRAKEIETRLK